MTEASGLIGGNSPEEKYENLGGVYFPILQQDGTRIMTKIGNGKDAGSFLFLRWLRQHDRKIGPKL
jgi:hypothetical protein